MTTAAELTAHAGSVAAHTAATNLANRDTTGPDSGLVTATQLATGSEAGSTDNSSRFLNLSRLWAHPKRLWKTIPPSLLITSTAPETEIISIDVTETWRNPSLQLTMIAHGFIEQRALPGQTLRLTLRFNNTPIEGFDILAEAAVLKYIRIEVIADGSPTLQGCANMIACLASSSTPAELIMDSASNLFDYDVSPAVLTLSAQLLNANPATYISILGARAHNHGQQL